MDNINIKCSVWVGDVEVNDYYLTIKEAEILACEYLKDDYDDVFIQLINEDNLGD